METKSGAAYIGVLSGLAAAVIWGGWPVLSKLALTENMHWADVTALRFFIAGLILLPFIVTSGVGMRKLFLLGIPLAIGAGAPYVLLSTYGLTYAPAGHFGIITPSTMLIFTSIGSALWLKEHISLQSCYGLLVIVIGILIVGSSSLQSISLSTLYGDLMFVGCGLLWSGYTLLSKYWGLKPLLATAMVSVVSMLLYIPGYLAVHGLPDTSISMQSWITQGIFQGVLSAIVALFLYSKAVEILGSSNGALFAALVPSCAVLLSVPVLNESIEWQEAVGVSVVTLGMLLAFQVIKPSKVKMLLRSKLG